MASDNYDVIWFQDVRDTHLDKIGNKAGRISTLNNLGYNVPQGFIVPTQFYEKYVSDMPLEIDRMKESIRTPKIRELYKALENSFLELKLDTEDERKIMSAYDKLGGACSVRSSSQIEDVAGYSFSGMFDSYNDIYESEILKSIKLVWCSNFSPRSFSYRALKGMLDIESKMAVIIQKYVEPKIKGVTMTKDLTGDFDSIIFSYIENENLAQKIEDPEEKMFKLDRKNLSGVSKPFSDVLETCYEIEKDFGGPQSIEWIIGQDGELYIVQTMGII